MQQVAEKALLSFLLTTTACASKTPAVQPQPPPRGGVLDFRLDSYDGDTVKGRLLLGATTNPLTIDSRKGLWSGMDFENVRACGTTEPLPHAHFCYVIFPPQPGDIITLKPGTWYGETVHFGISIRMVDHVLGPDCIETTLSASTADGQTIATIPVRIERTDKPAALGMSE